MMFWVIGLWYEWMNCWFIFDDLVEEDFGEVVVVWGCLGYLCWVLCLYFCVVVIVIEYDGVVFNSYDEFVVFLGIGDYIVSVVVFFVFGGCVIVFDINVCCFIVRVEFGIVNCLILVMRVEWVVVDVLVFDEDV